MSSPNEEMRSQRSLRTSSQHNVGIALEDTTMSTLCGGQMPGTSMTISPRAPNSMFTRGCEQPRTCLAFLGLQRTVSPVGLSIVQHCAQLVQQTAEIAMSGIEHIAEAMRQAHGVAEVARAEVTSMRS